MLRCCLWFVYLMQIYREEDEYRKKVKRERLEEARRSAVLTEWKGTRLPPQSEEVGLVSIKICLL